MTTPRTLFALWLLAVPTFAQPGNLLTVGRFDSAAEVADWEVMSPQYSGLSFEATADADQCDGSGSALATSNPAANAGTAEYRACVGPVVPGAAYWIGGEVRFPSSAVDGTANLTLSFLTGAGCTGLFDTHLASGYALSNVGGWQRVGGGPSVPLAGAQSVMLRLLLTQTTGSQPQIAAQFDELRVTTTDWIFAEDVEIGEACRWDSEPP
jgi:hypothetical protein